MIATGDMTSLHSRLLTFALAALLIITVLAFGGTHDWTIAFFEVGTALLVLVWAVSLWFPGSGPRYLRWSPLYPAIAAFALLVFCQILFHVSVYNWATRSEAIRYFAYGLAFFLVQQLLSEESNLRTFLHVFAWFGLLVAVEAIAQDFTANGAIYWHWPRPESGTIYGPYVNHSHYAGLMEMLWPIPIVLSLRESGAKRGLYIFFGMVMSSSILFSRSRGGSIALVGQAVFLLVHLIRHSGRYLNTKLIVGIAATVALVYFARPAGMFQSLSSLALASDPTVTGHRLDIFRDSLRMFRVHPLFGWGLDTFPTVYPRFRTFTTALFINEAHNDYLQVLVETGAIGFGLVVGFLAILYWAGLRRLDMGPWNHDAALIGLTACTGILIHSVTDFNLHITANAAFFYAFCSIATLRVASPASLEAFRADKLRRQIRVEGRPPLVVSGGE